jgi:hypothetical protein
MTSPFEIPPVSPVSPDTLLQMVKTELSTKARVGHVALLLLSTLMTTGIVSLWITEPALPLRTQLAFAVMTTIGVSWALFAVRVLTQRRVLFAKHSVVAGRMAVTFTATFVAGAVAVGYTTGESAGYAAAGMGAVLMVAAIVLLIRAQRELARLVNRRQTLEREVAKAR